MIKDFVQLTLMIVMIILMVVIVFKTEHSPLENYSEKIIEYADVTKEHLLPETLDDMHNPIPEDMTIDGIPKKSIVPMGTPGLLSNIFGRYDEKDEYYYKVAPDRKSADLYYIADDKNKSIHIDISDKY